MRCRLLPKATMSPQWWSFRSKGGRIIFEVALDWSEEKQEYRDMLRLWVSRMQMHCFRVHTVPCQLLLQMKMPAQG